jgi:lactoylglutathione lyase
MRAYHYDHVHLRSPNPDATARFFETMFDAEVTRSVYPPGTRLAFIRGPEGIMVELVQTR